jgi:hypothetical protein
MMVPGGRPPPGYELIAAKNCVTKAVALTDHFNQVQKITMTGGSGGYFNPGGQNGPSVFNRRSESKSAFAPRAGNGSVDFSCLGANRLAANQVSRIAHRQPLPCLLRSSFVRLPDCPLSGLQDGQQADLGSVFAAEQRHG